MAATTVVSEAAKAVTMEMLQQQSVQAANNVSVLYEMFIGYFDPNNTYLGDLTLTSANVYSLCTSLRRQLVASQARY